MKIEQAKTIPLSVILNKMDCLPQRETKHTLTYYSPIRKLERTPSFIVYKKRNRWVDYGTGKRGDGVDLVCRRLKYTKEDGNPPDALRWLDNMIGNKPIINPVCDEEEPDQCLTEDSAFKLKTVIEIKSQALIHYGYSRGIPQNVLRKYLKEVSFYNRHSDKTIFALGLKNESVGYEVRNPFFKGCVGNKDVKIIRADAKMSQKTIHVFEGMFDFLSVVVQKEGAIFKDDVMILNSLTCMNKAAAMIKDFNYALCNTWMDNDEPGQKATRSWKEFCAKEKIAHVPMNMRYEEYKDVNAHHMAKWEFKPV